MTVYTLLLLQTAHNTYTDTIVILCKICDGWKKIRLPLSYLSSSRGAELVGFSEGETRGRAPLFIIG